MAAPNNFAVRRLVRRVACALPLVGRLLRERDQFRAERDRLAEVLTTRRRALETAHEAQRAQLESKPPGGAGLQYFPVPPSACVVSELDENTVAQRMASNHVCLVKNVFGHDRSVAIKEIAERRMRGHWGGAYASVFADPTGSGERGDPLKIDVSVLLHLLRSPCLNMARAYFAEQSGTPEIVILLSNLVVRKFDPTYEGNHEIVIPFHQDAFGFPPSFDVLNFWTLLSPDECGVTSPGLEFILDRFHRVIGRETNPTSRHYQFLETSHDDIARYLAAYDPWRPSIALGDILIFDKFALHRTHLAPGQFATRHSAELRLIGLSSQVDDYLAVYPQPHFSVVGQEMKGPSVVRLNSADAFETVEEASWPVAMPAVR